MFEMVSISPSVNLRWGYGGSGRAKFRHSTEASYQGIYYIATEAVFCACFRSLAPEAYSPFPLLSSYSDGPSGSFQNLKEML